MQRREDVLRQALDKNAHETERWQAYKADNEGAMKNLEIFSKNLTVEVMVPIGKKALMPGELIHTNELLVGHYQGYFSACSAHKAQEICQHRLRLAEEHLNKLQVEADLWQNNLETPILQGAVPSSDEIEIVEEYNEAEHKNWLREHKERVRKEKQEERAQREAHANAPDDLFHNLEESEMLEELGLDPDNVNKQTLIELIQNEIKIDKPESNNCDNENSTTKTDMEIFDMLAKLEAQEQLEASELDEESEQNLQSTNELVRNLMNGETLVTSAKQRVARAENNFDKLIEDMATNNEDGLEEEVEEEEESDIPEEVKLIRQQMAVLPREEREKFLQSQLQVIKAKMRQIQKVSFISDELTHLMNVVVCLEDDLQEMLFEQAEAASTEELSGDAESLPDLVDNKKRRISFAEADEQLVFKQDETVAEMLAKGKQQQQQQQQREVVQLDAPLQSAQQQSSLKVPAQATSPQIMQKVERNLEFVQENQSVQDFDLVNKILEASTGRINTLQISFSHSDAPSASKQFDDTSTPGNPAHFYKLYKRALAETQADQSFPIYINSFAGEDELKVPILKEEERSAAYDDPRAQFSKFPATMETTEKSEDPAVTETKSILRNKSAVEREVRAVVEEPKPNKSKKNRNRKNKKPRTIDDDLRDMSAYQKVMQDLVEKEPTAPEPLPEGKYIETHAPKKRISRFKEQRSMNKT